MRIVHCDWKKSTNGSVWKLFVLMTTEDGKVLVKGGLICSQILSTANSINLYHYFKNTTDQFAETEHIYNYYVDIASGHLFLRM